MAVRQLAARVSGAMELAARIARTLRGERVKDLIEEPAQLLLDS